MGVPGLWEVLNKAGRSTSLAHLAVVNGFTQNSSQRRGYRVGIDTSIWLHHANFSKGGDSPEVRNLFFRLCFLKKLPIIPVFVFDGRQRPKTKRGSNRGKSGSHGLSTHFKKFIDAFGMEWHEAAAEAEAELAYLNRHGYIDAILTDDCDAFLFGARTILKNLSGNLSGNKNNQALNDDNKVDKLHAMLYNVADLKTHVDIGLSRGGMILFALLSGGDYHKGLTGFGKVIAHALSQCEFGDELLEAAENLPGPELQEFLAHWRTRVNKELRENTCGFFKHRTTLSVPNDFPDLEVLIKYTKPIITEGGSSTALRDNRQLDIAKVGQLCEEYFEWGNRQRILERFKTLIWPGSVMHVLRRAALEVDQAGVGGKEIGTPARVVQGYLVNKDKPTRTEREERVAAAFVQRDPTTDTGAAVANHPAIPDPHPLISNTILRERRHASTDGLLEYYIEVSPVQFVKMVNASLKGSRASPTTAAGGKEVDLQASFRMWVSAAMLEVVHPAMVQTFRNKDAEKVKKAGGRGRKRNRDAVQEEDDDDIEVADIQSTPPASTPKEKGFAFTCPDPTYDEFIMESIEGGRDASPVPTRTTEVGNSSTHVGRVVDQILDNPQPKKKRKDNAESSDKVGSGRSRKRASKKIKIPKGGNVNLLELLDSVDLTFSR